MFVGKIEIVRTVIFISCCFIVKYGCVAPRTADYLQLRQYADKFVSAGILWTRQVKSAPFCAVMCAMDAKCTSFFIKNNVCSGYDQAAPVAPDIISLIGTEFYVEQFEPVPDWCTGDRFVKNTSNSKCYKAWDTQLAWSDAQNICQGEGGRLAILDTASKIDLMAIIPGYQCVPGVLGPFVNKCYWTTSRLLNYVDSATECKNSGSILASFPSNSTYYLVLNGTGILQSGYWWTGLNDNVTEGVLRTYDNKPPLWSNMVDLWGYFSKDCMVISPPDNFRWIEQSCLNASYKAVCELPLVTDFWIGGSDAPTEGVWKWTNGANMDMLQWHTGQPDGNSVENCAVLKYDSRGTKFADEDCLQTRNFICEKVVP